MWTPKRIVLLVFGFVLFFGAYLVYASLLGGITGLPPLPEAYWPRTNTASIWTPPDKPKTNSVLEKLKQAFGLECPELARPIKLELHSKSTVLASDEFQIEPDGRVRLSPLSVALFGKDRGDGRGLEINTLRGNLAYLTFDRPISNLSEIGSRKIVEVKITGNIEVVNNRRTPNRDDDLFLFIGTGPLYYKESTHLVWTEDAIKLLDYQSRPKPTEITGKGLEMELMIEAPPVKLGTPPGRKARGETISGVKRIVLRSNVDMDLYVDGGSGFLSGPKGPGPAKGPVVPHEKAHVKIKTPGRFQYDILKDHDMAHFDVPPPNLAQPPSSPQDVTVTRYNEKTGAYDQLICEHLALRVRRKDGAAEPTLKKPANTAAGPAAPPGPEQGLDIETAHAVGKEVTLTSDVENLDAHGNEFFYDAVRRLTVIRGQPEMWANKEGSRIFARELQLQEQRLPGQPAGARGYQQITAMGPGHLDLLDKGADKKPGQPPTREKPAPANPDAGPNWNVHAFWNDRLTSGRDGPHDLLVLTGEARFVDDEHHQTLQGETLKVWLNAQDKAPDGVTPAHSSQQARRPHHVEAIGNVAANSPEMNIHDSSRLVVWFKDVPVGDLLPESLPLQQSLKSPSTAAPSEGVPVVSPVPRVPPAEPELAPPAAPMPAGSDPGRSDLFGPAPAGRADDRPPRPIDLSARSIEAWVLRSEVKSTLEKLWTEGSVHVRQDPAKPDEKGVDIKGEMLEMNYHPEGNTLVVRGDLAQLRMDKIYILGPEVNIDQATNKAWVNDFGAMQMESATDFQGSKLERPVPLTIHWNKWMFFNGKSAEFHGGIQAEQENARLACQSLQVFFDQPVSLKEGNHSDRPARVQNMVCDHNVRIEDSVSEGDRLIKYQRIEATVVAMEALRGEDDPPASPAKGRSGTSTSDGNEIDASGPGNVRILQRGGTDPAAAPAAPPPRAHAPPPAGKSAKGEEEMKMTYVSFAQHMKANSKTNLANFYGNIRVLNFPCEDPNLEIDLDVFLAKLPEGAMYLRCEQLTVLNRGDKGKSQQEMLARGRAVVQSKDFWGRADTVAYNEAKDQVIFDGGESGLATLYRVRFNGGEPEEIKGKKITYRRTTGEFKVDEGSWINRR